MSIRIDATWTSGITVSAYPGLGIRGTDIPTTGTSGGSILANDVAVGEETDEFRALILTMPSGGGTVTFDEAGRMVASSFADGLYSGTYQGFKNGVSYGSATYSFTIGTPVPTLSAAVAVSITTTGFTPRVTLTF